MRITRVHLTFSQKKHMEEDQEFEAKLAATISTIAKDVEITRLKAEIKRLREALEEIVASTYSHAQHARRFAVNALKPKEMEVQNG